MSIRNGVRTDVLAIDPSSGDDPSAYSVALAHWLRAKGGKPEISVVFSDLLVRFAVVPPLLPGQLLTLNEFNALALARLTETYGDMSGWSVAPTRLPRFGRSTLVSAIKIGWIDMLQDFGVTHKMKVSSIQPAFTAAWNKHCGRITSKRAQFVFIHSDFTTCVVADDAKSSGGLLSARVIRSSGDNVLDHCDQQLLLNGLDPSTPRWTVSSSPSRLPLNPSKFDFDLTVGNTHSPQGAMATLVLR